MRGAMECTVVAAFIIFFLAAASYARNGVWIDDVTLWSNASLKSPYRMRSLNNTGYAFYEHGDSDEAIKYYLAALRYNPMDADTLYNTCMAYFVVRSYQRAKPFCTLASITGKEVSDVRYTLRLINLNLGEKAIETLPDGKAGHDKLLNAFGSKRQ